MVLRCVLILLFVGSASSFFGRNKAKTKEKIASVLEETEKVREEVGEETGISSEGEAAPEGDIVCDATPKGFEDVPPAEQNQVDRMIQIMTRNKGAIFVRKIIASRLRDPNSKLRAWFGKMLQDPADPDFEEGDAGVTSPMPTKLATLVTKIFGETRTVVGYLKAFGFFARILNKSPNEMENYNGMIPPCAVTEAVKEFQLFNGLPPNGVLTKETRSIMAGDRCGNPDVECTSPACQAEKEAEESSEYLNRRKRYDVQKRRWKENEFRYFFQSYSASFDVSIQRRDVQRALQEWSDVAAVSFTEVDNERDADILIGFGAKDHGDKYPFSGPGVVLAHGFYPKKGVIHFDEDENFTHDSYSGINLYYVAVHEFGHVLGVKHSGVRRTIMYPSYPGFQPDIVLNPDDVAAAIVLFGEGTGTVIPLGDSSSSADDQDADDDEQMGPTEELGVDNIEIWSNEGEEEEECISRIDAAFNHPNEKYAYVLSGPMYVRLEADENDMPTVSAGYPKAVSDEWPGIDGPVDAAFTDYVNDKTYFFMRDYSGAVTVFTWKWDSDTMIMAALQDTRFRGLPDKPIHGIASYRDYVMFLYEEEYYLYTEHSGLQEANYWPTGDREPHVSGAFDSFLRGYFYTGNMEPDQPKYALFKSRSLIEGESSIVEKYSYRTFEEDMDLNMCY